MAFVLLVLLVLLLPPPLAGSGGAGSALPCTIQRIDAVDLSAQDFLDSRRHHAPLLIGGLMTGWRARSRWTWDFLLGGEASGAASAVNVGTGASIAASGLASVRPSLSNFVRQSVLQHDAGGSGSADEEEAGNPRYIFDGEFFTGREPLRQDFHVPIDFFPFQANQDNVTFFAGRAGSGLGFHKHGEAINALVLGRKRWLVYRPESLSLAMGMDPSLSGTQWLAEVYPTLPEEARPEYECVQEAGEIMCKHIHRNLPALVISWSVFDGLHVLIDLPSLVHHATVNLEDSLGVATRQATGGRVDSDAFTANSLADGIMVASARSDQLCGGGGAMECASAHTELAALLMEAGRVAEALPLLEVAIAVVPPPYLALMLHGELLLRRGKWYSPSVGSASILGAYDDAIASEQAAEAEAEAAGAQESEVLAVGGDRHMFTGPSTWREAALRQLCPMQGASGLKNCYHLTMAALMGEPPRYKLATQAGQWALAAVAAEGGSAPVMADDGYHTHGIQLGLCRAFANLAMEHTPGTSRSIKRWTKAERHCLGK